MTRTEQAPDDRPATHDNRRTANLLAWLGPLIVFVGAISYFLFFARFPLLRDFPWLNLPLVVVGLIMSAVGLRHALDATRTAWAKLFGSVAFVLSLTVAVLFGTYIFYFSYQLPKGDGALRVSQAAPDFKLPDQHGQTIELSALRGKKVILAFYRGHW